MPILQLKTLNHVKNLQRRRGTPPPLRPQMKDKFGITKQNSLNNRALYKIYLHHITLWIYPTESLITGKIYLPTPPPPLNHPPV